ncbi:MAG: DUF599 domain-containing protein [Betaproteobacteria bacterium]
MSIDFSTLIDWVSEFGADTVAFTISVMLLVGHYVILYFHVKRDPTFSIHYVNDLTRRIWVESVMSTPGQEIMAVQTLRNFIMVCIVMISTVTLLIIGTLTLSGQAEVISHNWHALNLTGSLSPKLWIIKVMCLLAAFLVAFFAYSMAIRLSNHVLFMINIPKKFQDSQLVLAPAQVARRLNHAGHMHAIGFRALVMAIPLLFWLFGPLYLLLATAGVVAILSRIDRHKEWI